METTAFLMRSNFAEYFHSTPLIDIILGTYLFVFLLICCVLQNGVVMACGNGTVALMDQDWIPALQFTVK